jgi:hypothetical protein
MQQTENRIDLNQLSTADLEYLLAEKKKEERQAKLKARETYESGRDILVEQLVARAKVLNDQMRDFKQYAIDQLEAFRETANDYGDIRKNSKGGFSLRHRVTGEMVSLDRNSIPEYDERAASAEGLLKEFLEDKVKKRDLPTYRTIMALMERNKQGDLTPSRIGSLLKVKDNYEDERWRKAMELFEESFRIREISYSVSFFRKDGMQKDQAIVLTFASIPVNFFREESQEAEQGNGQQGPVSK